jgi:hypothetical protein
MNSGSLHAIAEYLRDLAEKKPNTTDIALEFK